MSADSPKRPARCVPSTVPPQAVSDRSLLDSVTGFINDVALTNVPQVDPKDTILWARFETAADVTDPTFGDDWDLEGGVAPPLLLLLGYGTGVQVWAIPANGEAVEVLSWRHGSVRALRVLPLPITSDCEAGDDVVDVFASKRPLMAVCDANTTSGPQFCSVNFISLRDGDQVKSIKFKNPILDILANRSVVVVTFAERIAVFDARNLDDRLTVTTCHPGTSFSPNPVTLGTRWLAYAERKLLPSKRSSGGCDCDGVASYRANFLNAAKSLGKGLRELGEQMAAGFAGTANNSGGLANNLNSTSNIEDIQPGVVTIMDTKYSIKDNSPTTGAPISSTGTDPIIAHFVAHSDAIVALSFDCSGMLLSTADRRGHDFHVFRIQPHPGGPSLSAVHHLYVLHRGDTTAKVQDIVFSLDSRWIAVSTLRGTTHVFPVTPYGGPAGVRTHGSPHVVNRLSRFHRSAGLSDARANSPVHTDSTMSQIAHAYNNPRVPPFPHPLVVLPLAQLRQPTILGQSNNLQQVPKNVQPRQRLTSLGDEPPKPLKVCATFAKARAWLLEPPGASRDMASLRLQRKAVDSLFIMASHGALIQYDLEPKHNMNIPKDKICDDTAIELEVEPKAQWNLLRKECSNEIQPPLPLESWLLKDRFLDTLADNELIDGDRDDRWLSQVEIITHAGPHRRLWMGPQFIFKTYNTPSGAPLSHIDSEAVEIGVNSAGNRPARSNPMNMPLSGSGRSAVPVLIESGSCSSYEHSPRLVDQYRHNEHMGSDFSIGTGDLQLREDLADAMRESPGHSRDSGLPSTSSTAARTVIVSIAKVVNPLGTVTTLTQSVASDSDLDYGYAGDGDEFIHENCDEALFRPVVAVFGGSIGKSDDECHDRPNEIGQELIVPVIEKKNVMQNQLKKLGRNDCNEMINRDDKMCSSIKKDKSKKDCDEKAKESEKRERKKSDTKQPKIETKAAGKRTEKIRKESVGKSDFTEPIAPKSEKATKSNPYNEVESLGTIDTEVVILKLPKKSQKKVTKMEEQKRETTPPKSDEVDLTGVKMKSRKSSTKQSDDVVEINPRREESKISPTETANIKSQQEDLKVEQCSIEAPTPLSIEEDAKVKNEDSPKPIPQERASKKQKKNEKASTGQCPKMNCQTKDMEKVTTFDSEEFPEIIKRQEDDETEIVLPMEKTSKRQKKTDKISREPLKPVEEWPKISFSPSVKDVNSRNEEIDVNFTVTLNQSIDNTDDVTDATSDYMDILNEELRSVSTDCSDIQESLFRDPVVTTTFTVKKSMKKPSFSEIMNSSSTTGMSAPIKTVDFDSTNLETDTFTDVFAPLKPFDIDFEQLTFKDTSDEPISLINFESPLQDIETNPTTSTFTPTSELHDKEKLIFALCGSLHCDEDEFDNDDDLPPPPPMSAPPFEAPDSDYKSLELDIDETYLSFELPAPLDTTKDVEANSSDDSEDSSSQSKANKDDDSKYKTGMDEELQPLIGLTISSVHFDVAKENDTLPVEEEDDAMNQMDMLKQTQQVPEKQGFGNKKKSKKKRR